MWTDTLFNFISGLGGANDKRRATTHTFTEMTQPELDTAYRSDWIARKIVDIPAYDSTREWRLWQADDAQIEKLEEAEKALCLQQKILDAAIRARLYGGSAMVIGVDDGQSPDRELLPDAIGEGDLKFVHVLSRHQLTAGPLIEDILNPFFGEPSHFIRQQPGKVPIKIHPSRVVRLIGASVPEGRNDGWGDSILQVVDDAIKDAGTVAGSVATMVHDSKIDILKIPNMAARISTDEYKAKLTARLNYANTSKSFLNMLAVDKEEEWLRIQTNFGGLPEIMRLYLLIASGAADIPATRFLGQSPLGLNATGDSDTRNYYDRLASDQELTLKPALSRLDEVFLRHVFGHRDPNIYYEWAPLWQMDESQKADIAVKKANVVKIDSELGLIPLDALAEARTNQLVEDGFYPGLEAAIEDAELEAEIYLPEPDPLALPAVGAPKALPAPAKKPPAKAKVKTDSVRPFDRSVQDILNDWQDYNEEHDELGRFAGTGSLSAGQHKTLAAKTLGRKLTQDEETAVTRYGFHDYTKINEGLRKGSTKNLDTDYKKGIKYLTQVLDDSSLAKEIHGYRFMDGAAAKKMRAAIGKTIVDKAFLSTTTNPRAYQLSGRNERVRVILPKGAKALPVAHITKVDGESEVLVQRGSRFSVSEEKGVLTLRLKMKA